jgi:TonB family protein
MRFCLRLLATGLLACMGSAGSWAQLIDARELAPLQIEYPPVSKRLAEEGRVLLSFVVGANGQVDSVEVVASSGHRRLDEAAKAAVSTQRFVPASKDGVSIESKLRLPVIFKMFPSGEYVRKVTAVVALQVPQGDKHPGNPEAVVRLRLAPDGKILDSKLERSSSDEDWDKAVLRTLGRIGPLPPDEDGNIPDTLILGIRPMLPTRPAQGASVGAKD